MRERIRTLKGLGLLTSLFVDHWYPQDCKNTHSISTVLLFTFLVCVCVCVCVHVHSHSYLTLYNPMDCSPTSSSAHRVFQVRMLKLVAIPFLQGIFLTQRLKLGLLQTDSFPSEPPGKLFHLLLDFHRLCILIIFCIFMLVIWRQGIMVFIFSWKIVSFINNAVELVYLICWAFISTCLALIL